MKGRRVFLSWFEALLLLGLFAWVGTATDGQSAEWFLQPSLAIKGEYNSNLTLTAFDHDPTFGHWVSPGARFGGATEALEVSGQMAADFVQYYGGQNVSLTNLYFPLATKYRMEKEIFSLDGGFTRDNTLMGELRQTGVVLSFTQRNLWRLNPSWTHNITEKLSTTTSYQFNDVSYDNGSRLGLVDYQLHVGSAGASYLISERDRLDVTGLVVRFGAPDLKIRSTVLGPQLSYSHNFSESLTAVVSGGPRHVSSSSEIQGRSLSDSSVVWVFSGSVEKQWESWSIKTEIGREINPSGFGLLIRTDRVGLNVTKQLTEHMTTSISGAFLLADGIKTQTTPVVFPENRYLVVTPRLNWQMSEWWTLDISYNYSQRDLPSASQTALANSFTLMLTYVPVRLSVGR